MAGPYNGSYVGNPTLAPETNYSSSQSAANFGDCVALNGTNQYIALPQGAFDAPAGQPFTVECRLRCTQTTGLFIAVAGFQTNTTANWYMGVNAGKGIATFGFHFVPSNVGGIGGTVSVWTPDTGGRSFGTPMLVAYLMIPLPN